MPFGPLQDSRSSPCPFSSFQQTVRETAGHPPWGCSGGSDSHTDCGAHHQGPNHLALAKQLGDRKEAESGCPHHTLTPTGPSYKSTNGIQCRWKLWNTPQKGPSASTSCERGLNCTDIILMCWLENYCLVIHGNITFQQQALRLRTPARTTNPWVDSK